MTGLGRRNGESSIFNLPLTRKITIQELILKSLDIVIWIQIKDHDHLTTLEIPLRDILKLFLGNTTTNFGNSNVLENLLSLEIESQAGDQKEERNGSKSPSETAHFAQLNGLIIPFR